MAAEHHSQEYILRHWRHSKIREGSPKYIETETVPITIGSGTLNSY